MTREALVQWLRREPFLPFEIRMSNGDRYPVPHPEYAALGKTNVIVFFPDSDRYAELALLHMAAVEQLEASQQTSA